MYTRLDGHFFYNDEFDWQEAKDAIDEMYYTLRNSYSKHDVEIAGEYEAFLIRELEYIIGVWNHHELARKRKHMHKIWDAAQAKLTPEEIDAIEFIIEEKYYEGMYGE